MHRLSTSPQKRYEERYAHVGSGLGVLFTTSALDGREVLDENYSCSCQSSVFTLSLTGVWEGNIYRSDVARLISVSLRAVRRVTLN